MDKMKFKTTINCNGCLTRVKPHLDKVAGENQWEVDLDHDDKILMVDPNAASKEDVEAVVRKVGFEIEPLEH